MCHGYRQLHCIHKNRRYLDRYCAEDIGKRLDSSNYQLDRPLPKKVIGLIKNEFSRKIMEDFSELTPKIYSYLIMKMKKEKVQKREQNVS